MELAYLRIMGDAVDPGLLPYLAADPELRILLGAVAVGAVFAIRHFWKKKKKK